MLRNVIGSESITEIYKVADEVKRGAVVAKDLEAKVARKADGEGVDIWFVDADNQPTGALAEVDISAYDPSLDTVKANSHAILKKYPVGASIATDQVTGEFNVGDFAIAQGGLLAPAQTGQKSVLKFVGEYNDGGKKLHRFEIVNPHEIA